MSDNKPDYAKFMRNPASPEPGRSSREADVLSHRGPSAHEEDIPWAEIIVEPGYAADLNSVVGKQGQGNRARSSQPVSGPKANAVAAVEPSVGINRRPMFEDESLDYSVDADFHSRVSLFPAGVPVGAAPPIAVLVVVALVVFVFLFQ